MAAPKPMTGHRMAELLASIEIPSDKLLDLQRLYENPNGFPFALDKKNIPYGETIASARFIGCAIRDLLGDDFGSNLGINYIGFCDRTKGTFKMKANVRQAIELLGWFMPGGRDANSSHSFLPRA